MILKTRFFKTCFGNIATWGELVFMGYTFCTALCRFECDFLLKNCCAIRSAKWGGRIVRYDFFVIFTFVPAFTWCNLEIWAANTAKWVKQWILDVFFWNCGSFDIAELLEFYFLMYCIVLGHCCIFLFTIEIIAEF